MSAQGTFFKTFPGDDIFAPQRCYFSEAQWCWYFHLKYRSWLAEQKGHLPNVEKMLLKLAQAKTDRKGFKKEWKEFMATMYFDGDDLIFPDLIANARGIKKESQVNSVAGQISAVSKSLAKTTDSAARAALEKEKQLLLSKTKTGKAQRKMSRKHDVDETSTLPRGPRKPRTIFSHAEKILWRGVYFYPSELKAWHDAISEVYKKSAVNMVFVRDVFEHQKKTEKLDRVKAMLKAIRDLLKKPVQTGDGAEKIEYRDGRFFPKELLERVRREVAFSDFESEIYTIRQFNAALDVSHNVCSGLPATGKSGERSTTEEKQNAPQKKAGSLSGNAPAQPEKKLPASVKYTPHPIDWKKKIPELQKALEGLKNPPHGSRSIVGTKKFTRTAKDEIHRHLKDILDCKEVATANSELSKFAELDNIQNNFFSLLERDGQAVAAEKDRRKNKPAVAALEGGAR